jgi:hypothetical protein
MKINRMKKFALIVGMASGFSGLAFSANAAPGYEDCVDLKWYCEQGRQSACDLFDNLCWVFPL